MSYAQVIQEQIVTTRKRRGLSQAQLAEMAGLTQVTVSRIETTTRGMDVDEYVRIASALGWNAGDLLPNSGGLMSSEIKPLVEQLRRLEPSVRVRTLRIVEQIVGVQDDLLSRPLAAPATIERTEPRSTEEFPIEPADFVEGDFDYPRELHALELDEYDIAAGGTGVNPEVDMAGYTLHARDVKDATHRVVKVKGDSMTPDYEEGWKLLVDTKKKSPQAGDPVAVYLKDEGSVLGYWSKNGDRIELEKANAAYKPVRLGDPTTWHLIGTVQKIVDAPAKKRRKR